MFVSGNDDTTHRSHFWSDAGGARPGGNPQCPEPPSVANTHCQQLTCTLSPQETESSPNNPQSLQSQQAPTITSGCAPSARPRIQWPQSSKRTEWKQFDEDVDQVLEVTAKGDVDHRMKMMTTLIVNIAAERFRTEALKLMPSAYAPSHRARKIP